MGNDEVYLMRFDALGDTLWTKVFGDPNLDYYYGGRQVKRTTDGGFLIVGDTDQGGSVRGFAIRTDEQGNEQWRRFYGWGSAWNDAFLSAGLGANGDLFMGGTRNLSFTDNEFWLQRTDSLGNVRWSVSWGGPYDEGACQITVLDDGHVLNFSGIGHGPNYQPSRVYMAKLDSANGSIIWEHEYGQAAPNTLLLAGKECPNGDLIGAGGSFVSTGPNNDKGVLLRTTSTGDSLWMFTYYYQDSIISNGQGRFYDVLPTADGGFIAAGVARNPVGGPYPPGYSQDTWVVKVDSLGCIVPGCNSVGISEQATNLLDAISIFPNPAHDGQQVTVQLTLPPSVAHLPLQLSVVGMDGRVIHQQRIAGNDAHQLALPAVSAGLYYIHLAADGKWLTGGKLMIQ
ncbi:MAG: T9SS type A sorting domain-containing protein [Flavobacteriales bacterium]|nr:T9SS type A sorting domain-containing protein [Flavobacteriales bacterium]